MRHWILGLSIMGVLSACSKDSPLTENPIPDIPQTNDEGVEVRFNSGVIASTEILSTDSRAPFVEPYLPANVSVGMFGVPAVYANEKDYTLGTALTDDAFQDYLLNAEYITGENGAMEKVTDPNDPDDKATFPKVASGCDALVFYGYYPYAPYDDLRTRGNDFDELHLGIELPYANMQEAIDYLYAERKAQQMTYNPITINFKHALSRLQFNISCENDNAVATIDRILVCTNYKNTGEMNIADGKVTFDGTQASSTTYTYPLSQVIPVGKDNAISADFLLFPGIKIQRITCFIATDNEEAKSYVIYNDGDTPKITLQQGTITTVNVSFSPKAVTLTNSVEIWDDGLTHDMPTIEETPANK